MKKAELKVRLFLLINLPFISTKAIMTMKNGLSFDCLLNSCSRAYHKHPPYSSHF